MLKEILYDWNGANTQVFYFINSYHNEIVDRAMLFGTQVGSHSNFVYYLTVLLVIAVLAVARQSLEDAVEAHENTLRWLGVFAVFCLAFLIDGYVVGWLKSWFDFPRPIQVLPKAAVHILGSPEYRYSFPSEHASFAMLIVASFWPVLNRIWRVLAVLFLLWVGISRISAGANFPSDVVGGYLIALLIVLIIGAIIGFITRGAWRVMRHPALMMR